MQGLLDPLFKTLYTASLSMQIFLSLLTVRPVYFTDLLSNPHSIDGFRIGSPCLRDKHNNKYFWDPRPSLGVFYRQYQHRWFFWAIDKRKQLDPLRRWAEPVPRWTPFAHRESKCFESANFLVRSDSVCSICQRLTKSTPSAHRFKRLINSV